MSWPRRLAALLLAGAAACSEPAAPTPAPAAAQSGHTAAGTTTPDDSVLRQDDRIAPLLRPCDRYEHYDRNTSDLVPVLVAKLERGDREVLSRAIEELGRMGDAATLELRRAVERWSRDRDDLGPLKNALSALSLQGTDAARDALWIGLSHPFEDVRGQATRGLAKEPGRPSDFDRLEARLWLERGTLQLDTVRALSVADPARFVPLALSWIESRHALSNDRGVLQLLAKHSRGDMAERALALAEDAPPIARPFLAAPAAKAGDPRARTILAEELSHDQLERRAGAIAALDATDDWRPALVPLRADPDPQIRQLALPLVTRHAADEPAARDALRRLLDDPVAEFATYALAALVGLGDEEAIERALAALDGSLAAQAPLLLALRQSMRTQPDLAQRVEARLLRRLELERNLPLLERARTLAALAQVPLASAARTVLESAAAEPADRLLDGLDLHRWATLQAANSGVPGRAFLAERLADETHPVRRLDLIWAIAAEPDELARETLFARVDDEGAHELERLYAAQLLLRIGPAERVAPRLKRAALRMESEARLTLNCLLWTWY